MERKLETGEYIYIRTTHRGRPLIKKNFSIIKTSLFPLSRFLSRTYFYFMRFQFFFLSFFLWQRKTQKLPSVGSRPERGNFHEKMPEAALDAKQSASNSRSSDSPLASPLFAYTYVLTNSFCSFFRPGLLLELVFRGKLVAYFLQHRQEK